MSVEVPPVKLIASHHAPLVTMVETDTSKPVGRGLILHT